MFLTLMRPSLVLFLVLWLKLVKDFLKVRCRLALLPFLISCLIWLDLVASLPLIKERIFFFQAVDGIRGGTVTGVQTCALPILVAAQKGYRLVLAIPDKMSQEKIFHLRAMGAEVQLTRSDVSKGHPEYYRDVAERLAREIPNSFYVNQFNNPANPRAHEETTAPEIWSQMQQRLDAVVCGVGTGGTLTGLSRFFARTAPGVEMVLADPANSILANYAKTGAVAQAKGGWLVEGIGGDSIP